MARPVGRALIFLSCLLIFGFLTAEGANQYPSTPALPDVFVKSLNNLSRPATLQDWGKKYLLLQAIENQRPVFEVYCSAYYPEDGNTPSWRTASGTSFRPGVVAVQNRYFEKWKGTWLWVEGYGVCKVEDCGSFSSPRKLDLAAFSVDWAKRFGVQKLKVVVLTGPGLNSEYLK